jgi:hypothetical protein
MRGPQLPTPLEQLGRRPFSFYPAIAGVEHNEWTLLRSSWDEVCVVNTRTRTEIAIPRRLLGGVSSIEEPFVIVGLAKDLEYRQGAVVPRVQRVIEMPRAVGDVPFRRFQREQPEFEPGYRAPVVGIRTENPIENTGRKKWFGAVALTLALCVTCLAVVRELPLVTRSRFFAGARPAPPFATNDDYITIVGKWGHPASTRARPARSKEGPATPLELFLLSYPDRGYTLVLSGTERTNARYLGAINQAGRFRAAAAPSTE